MFTIHDEQMGALEADARSKYLDELVQILKEGTGNYDVPDAEMRQEVDTVARQAESFGLRKLEHVGLFVVIASDIGHDFWDVFNAPYEVLTSTLLDEDTKAAWLNQWHESLIASDEPAEPADEIDAARAPDSDPADRP